MVAGYGKRIFPSLVASLPLRLGGAARPGCACSCASPTRRRSSAPARSCSPCRSPRCVCGTRSCGCARRAEHAGPGPAASAPPRCVALFGALSFPQRARAQRPLARPDAPRASRRCSSVVADQIALDRGLARGCLAGVAWRGGNARGGSRPARVVQSGLLDKAGRSSIRYSADSRRARARRVSSARRPPRAAGRALGCSHTQPDEPVLFLPDVASYYYLTRRPSPIRFVLGHQIVTDAHRAEALRRAARAAASLLGSLGRRELASTASSLASSGARSRRVDRAQLRRAGEHRPVASCCRVAIRAERGTDERAERFRLRGRALGRGHDPARRARHRRLPARRGAALPARARARPRGGLRRRPLPARGGRGAPGARAHRRGREPRRARARRRASLPESRRAREL